MKFERRRIENPEVTHIAEDGTVTRLQLTEPLEYLSASFEVDVSERTIGMTKEHRAAADQALVMDAPRIIRKDMTLLTELVAKYQGLEGALNGAGKEEAANEVSGLVVPLVTARAALEHALETISTASAPSMPGVTAEQSQDATQAAFDMEDALMAYIEEHNKLPQSVVLQPAVHDLIQTAWPGRDSLKLAKGSVAIARGPDTQTDRFAFLA